MALHWEEAKVVVVCGGPQDVERIPDDAIVVTLRPEEVSDPEAVDAVRNLLLDRTIEYRQSMIDRLYDLGVTLPDPTDDLGGEQGEEEREAEQRLLGALREREGAPDGRESDDDGCPPVSPLAGGLALGSGDGGGVRVFISHVEELVVHN